MRISFAKLVPCGLVCSLAMALGGCKTNDVSADTNVGNCGSIPAGTQPVAAKPPALTAA